MAEQIGVMVSCLACWSVAAMTWLVALFGGASPVFLLWVSVGGGVVLIPSLAHRRLGKWLANAQLRQRNDDLAAVAARGEAMKGWQQVGLVLVTLMMIPMLAAAQSGSASGTFDQADFARKTRPEDDAAMLQTRALRMLKKAEKLEEKREAGKEVPEAKITKCRERAADLFLDAVGKDPVHFEAWTQLGETRLLLGDAEAAKAACLGALGINQTYQPARECAEEAYRRLGVEVDWIEERRP